MRLVTIGLAVLLLSVFQPAASAEGCRIDLSDPTNPGVYGDCLGTNGTLQSEENHVSATRTTMLSAGIDDDTGCEEEKCAVTFTQTTEASVTLHGAGAPPDIYLDLGFNVGTNNEGATPEGGCMGGLEVNTNVPVLPCMRMQG